MYGTWNNVKWDCLRTIKKNDGPKSYWFNLFTFYLTNNIQVHFLTMVLFSVFSVFFLLFYYAFCPVSMNITFFLFFKGFKKKNLSVKIFGLKNEALKFPILKEEEERWKSAQTLTYY